MQATLEFILKNSFEADTDFSIEQSEDEMGVVFTISLPEEHRGRVIGRAGRNIKAIRDILNILARRQNKRVFIKIAD